MLAGLAGQRDPGVPWDVLIVDNDGPPGTAAAAQDALAQLPVEHRVVIEPMLGASHARNRGIAEAKGTIVAFIDDDVVPDPDWLERLVCPLLEGRCDGIGGRVDLDPTTARPSWLPPWLLGYFAKFEPSDVEVDVRSIPEERLFEPYVLTANAAFTATILARSGGFDPALGPRHGVPLVNDDVALCRGVLGAGGRLLYLPTAVVTHELPPHRLRRRYLARRLYAQGRSDWLLDRERFGLMRTAGLRTAWSAYRAELRATRQGHVPEPRATFVWTYGVRHAGFAQEALTHLVIRWRRSS